MIMSRYIDAEKLYKKIDEQMAKFAELEKETEPDDMDLSIFYQGKRKMCSEILALIASVQQEQMELFTEELDKLVAEEFASHSRTTEYGWEVTYSRDELYQLFKRVALAFEVKKEE